MSLEPTPLLSCLADPAEALQTVRHMGVGLGRVTRQTRPSTAEGVPRSQLAASGFPAWLMLEAASPHFLFSEHKGSSPACSSRGSRGRSSSSVLGPGLLTGVNVPFDWMRSPFTKVTTERGRTVIYPSPLLCGAARSTGIPYLRGLSLNRVLWLPITELPPLLLLPSSSPWE